MALWQTIREFMTPSHAKEIRNLKAERDKARREREIAEDQHEVTLIGMRADPILRALTDGASIERLQEGSKAIKKAANK